MRGLNYVFFIDLRSIAKKYTFFYHGPTDAPPPPVGHDRLILEASRSHSDAPQSVGLLWTSDQSVAETSTSQYTTLTTDKHPCPGGIRTHNLSWRAAEDLRFRPRGHCRDRWLIKYWLKLHDSGAENCS
jgi:hypothetical protein